MSDLFVACNCCMARYTALYIKTTFTFFVKNILQGTVPGTRKGGGRS